MTDNPLGGSLAAIEASMGNGRRPTAADQVEPWQSPMTRHWSDIGLDLPADISWAEWEALGDGLAHVERTLKWALGDWLLAGEARFGEAAYGAAPVVALFEAARETIRKAMWVCERIPPVRRRTALSFGHHDAVASLDPAVADELLDRAEAEKWTRAQLRAAVRDERAIPATATPADPQESAETASVAADGTEMPDGCCPCCRRPLDPEGP